jgi:subtilisin family serine protease
MRTAMARQSLLRQVRFEELEPRNMMSASPSVHPLGEADFVLDYFTDVAPAAPPVTRMSFIGAHAGAQNWSSVAPLSLASAHIQTGLAAARAAYGLTGRGQTVAIIDTGIAFDHPALGAGWGGRVVGGWDFAENDANPYDDPAGAHGTHVAGIVGNSDATNPGVATGVDLVALRVFADNGSGYFHWVENALRWVYQNRNGFRNPITTVNLSLGAAYNGTTAPAWGQLEDEFVQLKSAGIFVAVAAGNDFASYRTPGLSYPAASPHVASVSAVDGSGNLASFSQRLDRVIAAPGVNIRSTVPDSSGNLNGRTDDWANFSGTSMASPYVAGAAVLIRQAMSFSGYVSITHDSIYQVMAATADWVYDPFTAQSYRRLNMQRALDLVMPADDYGSTVATAHNLGTIGVNSTFTGSISRISDHDYFTFTAATTGSVAFTASTSYELGLRWQVVGAGGGITSHDTNSLSLEVVAGQSYTIGVCTTAGVGFYSVSAATGLAATDLGRVDFHQVPDRAVAGEKWYSLTAARTGALTVEAILAQAGGNIDLRVYNSSYQPLATSAAAGNERIDLSVVEGQRLYVQLLGTNSDVSLRIANVLGQAGKTLYVYGTGGNDTFSYNAGTTHRFAVNGVEYAFGWEYINGLNFNGLAGSDTITLAGTTILDRAVLRPGAASLSASWYQANASGFENVTIISGGGADTAVFYDSAGDDSFVANPTSTTFVGAGATNVANGFARVEAYASTGNDVATFHDSTGNDTYIASPVYAALVGAGFYNLVFGFDRTQAHSTAGGSDSATLFDSTGNDVFAASPNSAALYGAGWRNEANGFAAVTAHATGGGWDMAYFFDSAGNDDYVAGSNYAWLEGSGFKNCGVFFDLMVGYASAGDDDARLVDSIYNDRLELDGRWAKLNGAGFFDWANGFDRVNVSGANGGNNTIVHTSPHEFLFSQLGTWAS